LVAGDISDVLSRDNNGCTQVQTVLAEAFSNHYRKARTMTAHYENFGVSFMYPENWEIVDEESDDWPRGVSVQSPEGGYWELKIYPSQMDLDQLNDEVLAAMRQEYTELESDAVSDHVMDLPAVGYNLTFFCLDLLVMSQIRSLHVDGQTYLLTYQAENREFDREKPVFDAITTSLLTG